jgi:carbamoyltransferase
MSRATDAPLILGLSGGTAPTLPLDPRDEHRITLPFGHSHDSAAALLRDGIVLAAVEEERLNRLKHTNKLPRLAIQACLQDAGATIGDVDGIAYYAKEDWFDRQIVRHMLHRPAVPTGWSGRAYLAEVLSEELDYPIDPAKLMFVEHHLAHAASACLLSLASDALVVTLDGEGDGLSGTVWTAHEGQLTRLRDLPKSESLGLFYLETTRYLAYQLFDEYKVMGLAPYGEPGRFRQQFEAICTLGPAGQFTLQLQRFDALPRPRRAGEPMTPVWQDLAAAGQETLERAALHLLTHYQQETGLRHLCAAGGLFHNSTLVGKIARSGLFDSVFVQPAASDAGCALGAALIAHRALAPDIPIAPMNHAYWGPGLGTRAAVGAQLERWRDLVEIRRPEDLAVATADLLAQGAVVGWVQGRSEFGPRALGNRSILADPRPAANKDRINDLVKHREAYRPFAPAVLAEEAARFFEMPAGVCADYMTMTVPVRPAARSVLGAVTHVDGSARVQTVDRVTNPRLWALIKAFEGQTGVPVLLNTSFNHSVEPIVQSIDDAMTCFLTTGLTHLVVDDFIVEKCDGLRERLWTLVPTLPVYMRIVHARQPGRAGGLDEVFRCEHLVTPTRTRTLAPATGRLLLQVDGCRSLSELADELGLPADRDALAADIEALWGERLLQLLPSATSRQAGGEQASAHQYEPRSTVSP